MKELEDRKKEEEDENLWKKLKQRVGKPTQINHHPPPTERVAGKGEKITLSRKQIQLPPLRKMKENQPADMRTLRNKHACTKD